MNQLRRSYTTVALRAADVHPGETVQLALRGRTTAWYEVAGVYSDQKDLEASLAWHVGYGAVDLWGGIYGDSTSLVSRAKLDGSHPTRVVMDIVDATNADGKHLLVLMGARELINVQAIGQMVHGHLEQPQP